MITMKMNVIDSTESTDTMTFINNEQSIIVNCHCDFLKFFTYCINSDTKNIGLHGNSVFSINDNENVR